MEWPVADILEDLKINTGVFEVYESRIFKAYRTIPGGLVRPVTIEILDGGPGAPGGRFQVLLFDEQGRRIIGSSHDNLQVAIALAHWSELDQQPGRG